MPCFFVPEDHAACLGRKWAAVLDHRVSDCVLLVSLISFPHERHIPNKMGLFSI